MPPDEPAAPPVGCHLHVYFDRPGEAVALAHDAGSPGTLAATGPRLYTEARARELFGAEMPARDAPSGLPPLYAVIREGRREGYTYPTREDAEGVAEFFRAHGDPNAEVVELVPRGRAEAMAWEAVEAERARIAAAIEAEEESTVFASDDSYTSGLRRAARIAAGEAGDEWTEPTPEAP